MEDESIVSKARTAFHSAATKAEQAFADFKSDLRDSDDQSTHGAFGQFEELSSSETGQKASSESKQCRWRPPSIGTKQEWHERLKSFGKGRKGIDDAEKVDSPKMAFAVYDANLFLYNEKVALEAKGSETPSPTSDASNKEVIPPASVLKQLAIALESEKNYSSVKDILLSTNSSPVRERASMSISAVKSFVLRDKGEKLTSEFSDDEAWSFIQSIIDAEGLTPSRRVGFLVDAHSGTIALPREIRGAPPESLIVKVSEVIGSFKMLRKMALIWCRIVAELRRLWLEEQYIPGIPHDKVPDLSCCLLYQQMQLMNCCVSRKKRLAMATSSLESLLNEAGYDPDGVPSSIVGTNLGSLPYVKTNTGEHVLRLGASHQSDNLTMLETGEAIYAPVTQEGPVLTEDLAREAEEFVLRTGSVGAGCSQLLSDMQAFKAANPGCILEDFVRWYSPPDWTENEFSIDSDAGSGVGDSTPSKGRLSRRMQKAGNLWRTFWETSKPVPAVRQAPLFDEDLAVEGVLTALERISPSQLFGQLFLSLLGLGFVIAEAKLSTDENMGKLFYECKEYVVASCQGEAWIEKIDDLCQVYETMEAMLMRPEDVIKMLNQSEDTNVPEEPKHRFKKFTQIFGGINRSKKSAPEPQRNPEDSPTRSPLSNFFDRKFSFSKKAPKPESPQSQMNKPTGQDENDWTVI